MAEKSAHRMIATLGLLVFTERLKKDETMNIKDYAIAIASVLQLANDDDIDLRDLQKELTGRNDATEYRSRILHR